MRDGKAEGRANRRKRETRARLLRAAFDLMAERGKDAVAINEITEAADVGLGSFYNHFDSKDAIHAALVADVLDGFGRALTAIADALDDPAEVLAASVRHVVLRAHEDPRWGRFLLAHMLSLSTLAEGMGRYLVHDLVVGLDAGRFRATDRLMAVVAVGGAAAAAVAVAIQMAGSEPRDFGAVEGIELRGDRLPERTASAALQILGIPAEEADEVARRPLPPVALPIAS